MIQAYPRRANLFIARSMCEFVEGEVLPGTGLDHDLFWLRFGRLVTNFSQRNETLLQTRKSLQSQIDNWHQTHPNFNPRTSSSDGLKEYEQFLYNIGYLEPEVGDFQIDTCRVDTELSQQAGPQLIVSGKNPRALVQAANARWSSLFSALYHSDVIADLNGTESATEISPARMARVIEYSQEFLDQTVPLANGSHLAVNRYKVVDGELTATLENGQLTYLSHRKQFTGFQGSDDHPSAILLNNNGLGIELRFDTCGFVGKLNHAGVDDIQLESVPSSIVDCEDSVATADVEDKIQVYRNWLALMRDDLQVIDAKSSSIQVNKLNPDRSFKRANKKPLIVPGRSLLIIRNVGLLMKHSAILDEKRNPIPEGILDAVLTATIALHDLRNTDRRLSRERSVYIVKPKLHGSAEVAFTSDLYAAIEHLLCLPEYTLKLGLMNEERRTSLNLKNCIYAARNRLCMLTTGYVDRIADEISTSRQAGPMVAKSAMIHEEWYEAYEKNHIQQALACGLSGRAQIGKGMWPYPERMAEMMKHKINHPKAGASAAWVPTLKAATLHTLHYHQVDVFKQHQQLQHDTVSVLAQQLKFPLLIKTNSLTPSVIQAEIESVCQNVLAYVVRWVEQGLGCSMMPDVNNTRLIEHNASLRTSCQQLANWLAHGVCSSKQVDNALIHMAAIVDKQNAHKSWHTAMGTTPTNSLAFHAARALVFNASIQPNGYTEPLLREYRLRFKTELLPKVETA